MNLRTILYFTLIGGTVSVSLSLEQLEGLKGVLDDLPGSAFPTCQVVFFSEITDLDTAENRCRNFNLGRGKQEAGNLVTFDSNDEDKQKDLKMLLEMVYPKIEQGSRKWAPTRWVWTGLSKTKGKKRTFIRMDHNGELQETSKSKVHPYACDYRGKYILSAQLKTWRDAKAACEAAGLHLAKVRNPEEVDEMKQAMIYFLGKKSSYWTRWNVKNWVFIGGTDEEKEKEWKWVDGQKIGWKFPWIPKAGGDNAKKNKFGHRMKTGQDALTMNRDGLFDDSFIEQKRYPFACQCPGT